VLKTIQKNELTISKNVAILTEIKLNIESLSKRKNSIHESNAESLLQLKTSLKQYQMELDSLESQYTEHLALKHLYEKIEPVLKDSGIKSLLIRKYIPIFNKLINHYLARLGLFVRFELDEEFNEKILSRNFDSFVYNSFSEGQRQRIDLAILLTWREITKLKNSIDCNLLIFDETLDASLDQSGVDSFIDIINEIEGLNIVVISHTPQKLQSFKRHFIYKLLGNFSQISKLEN
jgi:DNA repair exonuclease SbcCD ATPase subunit